MILSASILAAAIVAFWMIHVRHAATTTRTLGGETAKVYIRHFWVFGATAAAIAGLGVVASFVMVDKPTWQAIPATVLAIVVLILGERRWSRPSGRVRTVPLAARRLRDHVPVVGVVTAVIGVLAAVVVVGLCWMIGDTDGTSITRNILLDPAGLNSTVSVGGFPGWPQGALAAAGGVVLLLAVAYAVRSVVTRPALPGMDPADDLLLRRAAIDRVLRIVAVCGWVTALLFVESARAVVTSDEWPAAVRSEWTFGWLSGLCIMAAALSLISFRTLAPRSKDVDLVLTGSGLQE